MFPAGCWWDSNCEMGLFSGVAVADNLGTEIAVVAGMLRLMQRYGLH